MKLLFELACPSHSQSVNRSVRSVTVFFTLLNNVGLQRTFYNIQICFDTSSAFNCLSFRLSVRLFVCLIVIFFL